MSCFVYQEKITIRSSTFLVAVCYNFAMQYVNHKGDIACMPFKLVREKLVEDL